jgi:molybdate transport system ATP-binding protein
VVRNRNVKMLTVDIKKELPDFELSVAFEAGPEIVVLFGPSGAGKSLTLDCIAGLARPDNGQVRLGDRILFQRNGQRRLEVPLHKRRIGYVFQGYALFPHMTVAQNLAYGRRGEDRHSARQAVMRMLARLRLEGLGDRYPQQLSGGQQQRVALGRALMIEPELLLLDEPFAALDQAVREIIQQDILALQRELDLVMIYITHNLEDAFALGDRLVVIQEGRLKQAGPLREVFHHPINRTVAEITGVRNILEGEVAGISAESLFLRWGRHRIQAHPAAGKRGQRVMFYIRPEDVKLIRPDRPLAGPVQHNLIQAKVVRQTFGSTQVTLYLWPDGGPQEIEARFGLRAYQDLSLDQGQRITVSLRRDGIVLLPR